MTDTASERQLLLVELINTLHRPDGDDVLHDERADGWLGRQVRRGRRDDPWPGHDDRAAADGDPGERQPGPAAAPRSGRPDGDLRDLVRLREGLRQLARINNGQEPERVALEEAAHALATHPLTVQLAIADSAARLRPAGTGPAAAVFAEAATAYLAESAAGTWKRIKACANADCQYAYVDSSRNASRRWCDMSGCGNQAKQRGYRRRQQPGTDRSRDG